MLMEDVNFPNPEPFPDPSSCSMDSFFDDILNDTCTHTHTCNPPGPDLSHTHTCFHVHTKILSDDADTKKRPACGNREAVRKYRQKKKARTASLEDEVIQLRALNQQLMKRLQGHAALEAEVARMRCLLVDIRGRIEGEIGSFPYQKKMVGGHVVNPCDMGCDDPVYCVQPGMEGKGGGGDVACEIGEIDCLGRADMGSKDYFGCGAGIAAACAPDGTRINGTHAAL